MMNPEWPSHRRLVHHSHCGCLHMGGGECTNRFRGGGLVVSHGVALPVSSLDDSRIATERKGRRAHPRL